MSVQASLKHLKMGVQGVVMGIVGLGPGMGVFAQEAGVAPAAEHEEPVAELAAVLPSWLALEGLIEVEAFSQSWEDEDSADIVLATAELSFAAEPEEGVSGSLVLLWEEGATEEIEVDVATVELGGTAACPFQIGAGRMYMPFGAFESLMVSDPLALELGESRQTAVSLAWARGPVEMKIAAFAGELKTDDTLENAAAALTLAPLDGVRFGFSVITDIGQGGLADAIDESLAEGVRHDRSAGVSAFVVAERGRFALSAEYLGAVERVWLPGRDGDAARPRAWFADLACAIDARWTVAVRYEGSRDFLPDETPESQFGGALSRMIGEHAKLSVEHLIGRFDDADLDDRHLTTAQLALSF